MMVFAIYPVIFQRSWYILYFLEQIAYALADETYANL
jgi:hypothetical protein